MDNAYPQRKRLAHLPTLDRHNRPVIVFLTACTQDRREVLAHADMVAMLVAAWRASRQWHVGRYMVMPDHVHLFCSPAVHEAESVQN